MFRNTFQLNTTSMIDFPIKIKSIFENFSNFLLKFFLWETTKGKYLLRKTIMKIYQIRGDQGKFLLMFSPVSFHFVVSQRNSLNKKLEKVSNSLFLFWKSIPSKSIILGLLSWNVFLNIKKSFKYNGCNFQKILSDLIFVWFYLENFWKYVE